MKWPYSLGLKPRHMHMQRINSFRFLLSQEWKIFMTHFHRREAVTTHCLASKAKQLYFKQLCFAFKENVFSPTTTVSRKYPQLHILPRPPEATYSTNTVHGHHNQTWVQVSALLYSLALTPWNLTMDTLCKREERTILTS